MNDLPQNNNAEQKQSFGLTNQALQTYFVDAYVNERKRFDAKFGELDNNPPYEFPQYEDKIAENNTVAKAQYYETVQENTVPEKKYKKVKGALAAFVIISLVAIAAALYFGISYLVA